MNIQQKSACVQFRHKHPLYRSVRKLSDSQARVTHVAQHHICISHDKYILRKGLKRKDPRLVGGHVYKLEHGL